MAIVQVTLNNKSAFARSIENAAEEVVRSKLADLQRIMREELVRAIDEAHFGTSRPGTKKAQVTPIREAISPVIRSSSFPIEIAYEITAEDARPKIEAFQRARAPHVIRGNPWLVFPHGETGRRVRVRKVNWRPRGLRFFGETLAIQRARTRFLQLFR